MMRPQLYTGQMRIIILKTHFALYSSRLGTIGVRLSSRQDGTSTRCLLKNVSIEIPISHNAKFTKSELIPSFQDRSGHVLRIAKYGDVIMFYKASDWS